MAHRGDDDALAGVSADLATPFPVAIALKLTRQGDNHMRKIMIAALGAATMLFAFPAAAQDLPVMGGDYWTVSAITVDDGHAGDYADHLAGAYRKTIDFQKSKGWIKASYILANVNKRAGEPDLYLVTIADRPTTPAEDEQRAKETNAYLQSSARQQDAQSGERAKYRHLGGTMLLQEQVYRK
jgi:hypothetical protein